MNIASGKMTRVTVLLAVFMKLSAIKLRLVIMELATRI